MAACRYRISLLVFNFIFHSFAGLTREISSSTLEEKFHIYAHPCIMPYIPHEFNSDPNFSDSFATHSVLIQIRFLSEEKPSSVTQPAR